MATSTANCSIESFPFDYFLTNGTRVAGQPDPNGFCIFPEASCDVNAPVDACCKAKDNVDNTGDNFMFIAFAIMFLPYIYLFSGKMSPEEEAAHKERDEKMVPSWVKKLPGLGRIFKCGLWIYVALQVAVPIFMRNSIQAVLSVASRNTVVAAEAFLVPYKQIFQFIEDIILVRVNYAMAKNDKKLTNELVHIGLFGSFLSGILAALLATILAVIPPSLTALTNPGAAQDAVLYPGCDLFTDTTIATRSYWLVEAWTIPGQQMGMVLTGFMMGALELATVGWIGSISLVMIPIVWFTSETQTILLLAFADFAATWVLPFLSILYITSPLGKDLREHTGVKLQFHKIMGYVLEFWSRNLNTKADQEETNAPVAAASEENSVKESGGEQGTKEMPVEEDGSMAQLLKEGLKISTDQEETNDPVPVASEENAAKETEDEQRAKDVAVGEDASKRQLLKEGLKIMFMDVAIQFCMSLSIYLALLTDAAEAYQLTALQSALPTYGIAYALGMGVTMKIVGPILLTAGKIELFVNYARLNILCAFLLLPLILGSVIPFTSGLAFNYGANGCAYAKNAQCVPFFNNVFGPNAQGGDFSLQFTFDVFPLGAGIEAVFFVLRTALLTLLDLDYMVICTIGAIVVYIPVISVATLVAPFGGHAISFFVAMYTPQVVLVVCFLIRLQVLFSRMLSGDIRCGMLMARKSSRRSTLFLQSGTGLQ